MRVRRGKVVDKIMEVEDRIREFERERRDMKTPL